MSAKGERGFCGQDIREAARKSAGFRRQSGKETELIETDLVRRAEKICR